jgi:hypothetical protein
MEPCAWQNGRAVPIEDQQEDSGDRPLERAAPQRLGQIEAELAGRGERDDDPGDLEEDERDGDAAEAGGLEAARAPDGPGGQRVGVGLGVGRTDGGGVSVGSSWIPRAISASPSAVFPVSRSRMPRLKCAAALFGSTAMSFR